MHAPAPQHNAWKAQNRSYRNWFSPPNMWVPGVNSGHRAWWQTLLPATKPSHWSNDFKCFFKLFYFAYMGILLLCMPVYHKLRYPAEQSELLTAESSHQPSHLVSSTVYCTFTSSHSEGADDEC